MFKKSEANNMRLPPKLIEIMAFRVVQFLEENKLIETRNAEALIDAIEKALIEEMSLEDKLDEEVKELLAKHSNLIDTSSVEYHELFRKVKQKLAQKKGIIL